MRRTCLVAATLVACSAPSKPHPTSGKWEDCYYDCQKGSASADSPKPVPAAAAPSSKPGTPAGDKAADLRDAADLIDKAGAALAAGSKSRANELYLRAEMITGPEALASIARVFRDGAPPAVTTPTIKVENAGPQPKTVGSSEAEDAEAKVAPPRVEGSVAGTVMIEGKPLAGTYGLVTLEPATGKWKARTPKRRVVEQRMREFMPHIMAVPVGSTIAFPNFDTVYHNVFSTSAAGAFDLGIYKMGEAREFTFDKEGIVRLGCNLHANMSAYIAVVAAPAYVVTDDHGAFKFQHLEPGKYKVKAWSERSSAPYTTEITVRAGANAALDLPVDGKAPAGPAPDKFGGQRG
jgi:plastocyanin